MDLTYIEFDDHWTPHGNDWSPVDDETDPGTCAPLRCYSVGWVVAENETMLKLVANLDGPPDTADNGFGYFNILKRDIRRRVRLNVPPAPRKGAK